MGVPYSHHDGEPRDVTLRCKIWIWVEADEWEDDDPGYLMDPIALVNWQDVLVDGYSQEGFCRVDRAVLEAVRWENESKAEMSIVLDITFFDEPEALESLSERWSEDWDSLNDSFELPEPWRVTVGGRCEPLDRDMPRQVVLGEVTVALGEPPAGASLITQAGTFPLIGTEETTPELIQSVSVWLAGLTLSTCVATLPFAGQLIGFYQGGASRRGVVMSDERDANARKVTTGLIAVLNRIIDTHGVHDVALLPPEGSEGSWPWLDQRAAFAAAASVGRRKLGRAGGAGASIYMVQPGADHGRACELTQRSFWHLSSWWRSWFDLECDIPRLVERDLSELGAPQVAGLRVWEVVDDHVE